ncbi:protein S40-7 [Beta vulgaris subsp. vulgaris]|uniref:protein S40-7 n=1 Tax=Beta vulgaris subsp. vulgaris TaxID=3555 RepID=UPI002036F9F5|nr:protein S40-7 [Beta vulgaris subsp. vulgaris]
MEINGVSNYRHRKSPSSDRFFTHFSLSTVPSAVGNISDDELTEADLFWIDSDSSESARSSSDSRRKINLARENSGILAALPDDCGNRIMTPFRAIPKPPQHRVGAELTQSRKFQHSAPVNVPRMMMMRNTRRRFSEERENDNNDDKGGDDDDEEMLPPHEIVALKLKSTSSVLEGVGRTLKGRDLRQVRNAVWRQTGFLD